MRGGDVLAFEDPRGTERILVHRVVRAQPVPAPLAQGRYGERRRVELVTRGDANTGTERFRVDADGELGRYAFHLPAVGRPLASLHGVPLGVMVGLSGLALTFMALRRIWGTR